MPPVIIALSGFGEDETLRELAKKVLTQFSKQVENVKRWRFHLKKRDQQYVLDAFAVPLRSVSPLKHHIQVNNLEDLTAHLQKFYKNKL